METEKHTTTEVQRAPSRPVADRRNPEAWSIPADIETDKCQAILGLVHKLARFPEPFLCDLQDLFDEKTADEAAAIVAEKPLAKGLALLVEDAQRRLDELSRVDGCDCGVIVIVDGDDAFHPPYSAGRQLRELRAKAWDGQRKRDQMPGASSLGILVMYDPKPETDADPCQAGKGGAS